MKRFNETFIKVLSLGIGLAVGIVLIAKVFFELSYDRAFTDVERIYSIRTNYSQNGDEHDYGQVSGATAPGFKNEVPGVEEATRTTFVYNGSTYLDEAGNKISGTLVCADTSFFKIFDRPVLAGDPSKALGKWGCVMVSRSFAEKIARSDQKDIRDVLGTQICNEDSPDPKFTVEGIFEDFPRNSSLHYDILLSMETYHKWSRENWLGNDRYLGYVKLQKGVDPISLKDGIRKMQEAHQPLAELEKNGTTLQYYLSPFDKLHTSQQGVRSQIILLSVVAVLLLLISLLNYLLIVISSMVKRSKEVGVLKCYGAGTREIYGMLTREALLHLALSLVLSAVIILAGRNVLENLMGVAFTTLLVPQSIAAIVVVVLLVLAFSIVVPARLYLKVPVYAALQNYTENSRKWKLGLLGVQVLINVFLTVMLLIIGQQYEKVTHSKPGYEYANVFYVNMFDGNRSAQKRVAEALLQIPEVGGVEACNSLPFMGSSGDNVFLPGEARELFNIADQYEATEGFYKLMGMEFVAGRAPRDSSEIVVDEKFVRKMAEFADWSSGAVGKQVLITGHGQDKTPFTISGVYKDILIGNLIDMDNRPSARFWGELGGRGWMPHLVFKLRETDAATLERVRATITEARDGKEESIVSYAESMRSAYAEGRKIRNTLAVGAIFSLLIALLGLIGFIRDESLRRSKEVAVRKINGAVTKNILALFAWGIMKISLVTAVAACAGAFFVAQKWLELFAEKVSLSPLCFLGGTSAVLLIVLAVVIVSSLRISRTNPVESLKSE